MLRRTVWLSGLTVVLAAATVQAQDRQQPRFGQGGPGGFGAFQASPAMLLGMPEVQKELGVSDEQKGLIKDMNDDLGEQMRGLFSGFGDFQNLSDEERRQRGAEAQKKGEEIGKKGDEMISMILEPKQADRLGQLRLQREGVGAFNRDDIAKKLVLTQEQRDKIKKIQEDARPNRQGGGAGGAGGFQDFRNMSEEERAEFRKKMTEQREKVNADLLAVLTGEQKESWTKMQGKKFDFPAPQFGGFGGGPPGGGRPDANAKKKKDDK